ncbi:MAG: hypothetical protein AAFN70_07920, partial [Planctomycetota bacterium]
MNSGNSIQDFFMNHVEKLILGLIVLVTGFLIYQGYSIEGFDDTKPEDLRTLASQVGNEIIEDHWDNIKEERVKVIDIVARSRESAKGIVPDLYKVPDTYQLIEQESMIKRTDPTLLAASRPTVHAVRGTMAVKVVEKSTRFPYLLGDLEYADKIQAPKKKKKKKKSSGFSDMYDSGPGGPGGGDMYDSGPGSGYDDDLLGGGDTESEVARADRSLNKSQYVRGFELPERVDKGTEFRPAMVQFITGTALIPNQEIHDAYKTAFELASSYDMRRDLPEYLKYQVQRADITDKSIDELQEADWVDRLRPID